MTFSIQYNSPSYGIIYGFESYVLSPFKINYESESNFFTGTYKTNRLTLQFKKNSTFDNNDFVGTLITDIKTAKEDLTFIIQADFLNINSLTAFYLPINKRDLFYSYNKKTEIVTIKLQDISYFLKDSLAAQNFSLNILSETTDQPLIESVSPTVNSSETHYDSSMNAGILASDTYFGETTRPQNYIVSKKYTSDWVDLETDETDFQDIINNRYDDIEAGFVVTDSSDRKHLITAKPSAESLPISQSDTWKYGVGETVSNKSGSPSYWKFDFAPSDYKLPDSFFNGMPITTTDRHGNTIPQEFTVYDYLQKQCDYLLSFQNDDGVTVDFSSMMNATIDDTEQINKYDISPIKYYKDDPIDGNKIETNQFMIMDIITEQYIYASPEYFFIQNDIDNRPGLINLTTRDSNYSSSGYACYKSKYVFAQNPNNSLFLSSAKKIFGNLILAYDKARNRAVVYLAEKFYMHELASMALSKDFDYTEAEALRFFWYYREDPSGMSLNQNFVCIVIRIKNYTLEDEPFDYYQLRPMYSDISEVATTAEVSREGMRFQLIKSMNVDTPLPEDTMLTTAILLPEDIGNSKKIAFISWASLSSGSSNPYIGSYLRGTILSENSAQRLICVTSSEDYGLFDLPFEGGKYTLTNRQYQDETTWETVNGYYVPYYTGAIFQNTFFGSGSNIKIFSLLKDLALRSGKAFRYVRGATATQLKFESCNFWESIDGSFDVPTNDVLEMGEELVGEKDFNFISDTEGQLSNVLGSYYNNLLKEAVKYTIRMKNKTGQRPSILEKLYVNGDNKGIITKVKYTQDFIDLETVYIDSKMADDEGDELFLTFPENSKDLMVLDVDSGTTTVYQTFPEAVEKGIPEYLNKIFRTQNGDYYLAVSSASGYGVYSIYKMNDGVFSLLKEITDSSLRWYIFANSIRNRDELAYVYSPGTSANGYHAYLLNSTNTWTSDNIYLGNYSFISIDSDGNVIKTSSDYIKRNDVTIYTSLSPVQSSGWSAEAFKVDSEELYMTFSKTFTIGNSEIVIVESLTNVVYTQDNIDGEILYDVVFKMNSNGDIFAFIETLSNYVVAKYDKINHTFNHLYKIDKAIVPDGVVGYRFKNDFWAINKDGSKCYVIKADYLTIYELSESGCNEVYSGTEAIYSIEIKE